MAVTQTNFFLYLEFIRCLSNKCTDSKFEAATFQNSLWTQSWREP